MVGLQKYVFFLMLGMSMKIKREVSLASTAVSMAQSSTKWLLALPNGIEGLNVMSMYLVCPLSTVDNTLS